MTPIDKKGVLLAPCSGTSRTIYKQAIKDINAGTYGTTLRPEPKNGASRC